MAVVRFSKEAFEAALPKSKICGTRLWRPLGIQQGEECYVIFGISMLVNIMVRSSIDASGFAAAAGEDSIRAWLVDPEGMPVGSKIQAYVTRVVGWEDRLLKMLRQLARRAIQIDPCPVCKAPMGIFQVKKPGPNKGKLFIGCKPACKQFKWVKEAA